MKAKQKADQGVTTLRETAFMLLETGPLHIQIHRGSR